MARIRRTLEIAHTTREPLLDVGSIPEPPAWHVGALCRQVDPEAFFPDKGGSNKRALSICAQCPVINPCREWALDHAEQFGVWGGLGRTERRAILRERRTS